MPRKSKKQQIQAHGKKQIEDFQPSTLDEIAMGRKSKVYDFENITDYIKYLRSLDKADLRFHARKMGLVPVENRVQIERELVARFKKNTFSAPPQKRKMNQGALEDDELLTLLETGR